MTRAGQAIRRRTAVAGCALIALVLLGVECDPGAGASTTRSSSAEANAAAKALAKKGVLRRSDFPTKGWTTSKNPDSGNGWPSGTAASTFATCLGISVAVLQTNPPWAKAQEFDQNQQAYSVDEEVQVFPTAQQAATDVAVTASPIAPACFQQLLGGSFGKLFASSFTQGLGNGATLGTISATALPAPAPGQESAGMEITVPISVQSSNFSLYMDDVSFATGRAEASFTFLSVSDHFPTSLATRLETVTAQRLAG
jgi:hypothetical protein